MATKKTKTSDVYGKYTNPYNKIAANSLSQDDNTNPGSSIKRTPQSKMAAPDKKKKTKIPDSSATAWNPSTGDKRVLEGDKKLQDNEQLWTGGTASGEKARKKIFDKNKSELLTQGFFKDPKTGRIIDLSKTTINGMSRQDLANQGFTQEVEGQEYADYTGTDLYSEGGEAEIDDEGGSDQDRAADALGEEDEESIGEEGDTEDKGGGESEGEESMKDTLGDQYVEVGDYSGLQENLDEWKAAQIENIESRYAQKIEDQKKQNKNATNAWKAKLIKMGVPTSSTSYQSAVQSQEEKNQKYIRELERQETQEKASIRADAESKSMDLAQKKLAEEFKAMTTNIDNYFKQQQQEADWQQMYYDYKTDMTKINQQAEEFRQEMDLDWAKFSQDEREMAIDDTVNLIKEGGFDMSKEENVKFLSKMEQRAGVPTGYFIESAAEAYKSNILDQAKTQAEVNSILTETEISRQKAPYEIEKLKTQIANNRSKIADRISNTIGSEDIANTSISLLQDSGQYLQENAIEEDEKMDSGEYIREKNNFVTTMMELKPENSDDKYWERLFYEAYPPSEVLNTEEGEDKKAKQQIDRAKGMFNADGTQTYVIKGG